ncbi:glycosyltransferase [Calorimonas adulescens]|uniref:Glycosyltransferase n=1 Tax=Calorimonas adulescens TaxID=2606906 RepID=A0A5D8QEE0_9THEO|nr:glycosyltransferase [Calorimonas adulescens]TZE83080.1 glycosyltransferase [Calorimonas adulescens]
MKNINILQINTKYSGGGAANIASSLHNFINENTEHQSVFLHGRGKSNDPNSYKISNDLDVYFSAFSMRFFGESKNLYFDKQIERFIANADIVHLHNLHGYYINYEKLINLIIKYQKPVVWTFHDVWPITGRCAIPTECTKWERGCRNCKYRYIYPKSYIDKSRKLWIKKKSIFSKLLSNKTVIVTPSKWLANELRKSYFKEFNIEIIPNGVRNSPYSGVDKKILREELNLPTDKKIILFVAADINDERKGIKYVLDIINEFDQDILFLSVGKEIRNVKTDKLKQMGYISDREILNKIYRSSNIYINTTLGETFSLTTAEALSNALPVVAFNVGPIPDLVDENCGILVEKGNSKELKNAINKLVYDEQLLRKFSLNALKKYEENYTLEKFAERYLNIYKKLIEKS